MAAVLWLTVSLEWRSGERKQCRRGSATTWGSSHTQPPNCSASMGSPAATSQTHLSYCQCWELCRRCGMTAISDPAQALSAPLAIVFGTWEIRMLLIYSVSYIWDGKALYGSRGGWNILIFTGRPVACCDCWWLTQQLPEQPVPCCLCCTSRVASRLCSAAQTSWSQYNLSQITVSDAKGSSLW